MDIRDDPTLPPPPASPPPPEPAAAAKEPPDLSAQVIAAVQKDAGDVVRCTRVGRDNYRCNWWVPTPVVEYDNPATPGRLFTTHRVRKSEFLEVTQSPKGLLIRVRPDAGVTARSTVAAD